MPTSPSPADRLPEYETFAAEFMEREQLAACAGVAATGEAEPATGESLAAVFSKDFFDSQMEVVIEEAVPVYAAGLGSPGPWIERLHDRGTVVMSVVGAVRHAHRAVDSGVDVIVAQGHDAGGHNSPVGTMALVPQVVDVAGDIPVLAAGGIGDGRGIAAALMLGAEGVWLGTAFLPTEEAGIERFQKEALVGSTEEGTVISRSFTGKPTRVIRNKWARAWEETDLEPLPMPFQSMVSRPVVDAAIRQGREDIAPGFAGQGVGMVDRIRPAADVLRELAESAEDVLGRAESLRRA